MNASRALLIVHQEHSDPARVGSIVAERGYDIDLRCPNQGDPLPRALDEHDAVIVFGGPQSANDGDGDEAPGIRAELDFIPTVLESGTPFLGICLGAQLLAKTLGARIGPHPDGCIEAGYYEVEPTEAGRAYFAEPMMFYQWHREGFELPAGAIGLARSALFPNQAFRYGGNAFGLQFHPEVLAPTIRRWSDRSDDRLKMPGARPAPTHLEEFRRYDPAVDSWIRNFIRAFLAPASPRRGVDAAD